MTKPNETTDAGPASSSTDLLEQLLPCPFCGGPVKLEEAHIQHSREFGRRQFWGVVCRNTKNIGSSCCMEQVPSASKEAAIARWNMRNGVRSNASYPANSQGLQTADPAESSDESGN